MGDVIRKALLTGATGYTGHNLAARPLDDGLVVGPGILARLRHKPAEASLWLL